ncbi:hypothetical protein AC578_365 [Pseudocercospora eumusae]|uniref:F-box domain-containing protein n=1 Tax=Pseudocercospora eumusae TaxID=321146 RepID=A0A139HUH0_9PEZI|nr:hypothetical protein AC578_365 [Pseudocercospora eumusae]
MEVPTTAPHTIYGASKLSVNYIKILHRHVNLPIHIEDISSPIPKTESQCLELRSNNQFNSPLLRLPRELRDLILGFVADDCPPPLDPRRSQLPSLLSVSSQIRDEFAQIFYSRKLIMAGGAPSPSYEKRFFEGFCAGHKKL